jgi:ribonucleoside-triphosphate reductase (thioredoxin)
MDQSMSELQREGVGEEYRLNTTYQQFIHLSRYSRWLPELGRRETWEETVDRYLTFFDNHLRKNYPQALYLWEHERERVRHTILTCGAMPSMRAMMTAGEALERNHIAGYNCAYLAIDSVGAFAELMNILLNGTGVGFSVERQYINELPMIPATLEGQHADHPSIVVRDSKEGWVRSFRMLLSSLYDGVIPTWDLSEIRPAGARLRTFGGRASGPEPLNELFAFTVALFKTRRGGKLRSIDCHDLACKIGEVVVVGGVRRSALISLSNLTDERMRVAKSGEWWNESPHRRLANNSVAYTEKPDVHAFMKEWLSLYDSKSGERGVFNRVAAQKIASRDGRRDPDADYGTNPCSEIILLPQEFCNLTEVVCREGDTWAMLRDKVEVATILGTLQSTLTDFRGLRKRWKENCEEERLLGVSMTGIEDHPVLRQIQYPTSAAWLDDLKRESRKVNRKWARALGINESAAITCVKPSGTVSQLVNSASGMHPRWSQHYIRRVRGDAKDPLTQFLIEQGVPNEPDVFSPGTVVFSFPVKAPVDCITRHDRSAIKQLELWKHLQLHWCEHKPSVTVYVREEEWMRVGAWVYDNFDIMSGVAFLPHSDGVYRQPPYEDIDEETYNRLAAEMPAINWAEFKEQDDNTTASQELACVGGACEL